MNDPSTERNPHRVTWSVFTVLLLFATLFVAGTASELPLTVAAHFDAAGRANAYMSRGGYIRFVLCVAVGLPVIVVAILTAVYSRATNLKLPNREYWLDPQRVDQTRAFLMAHGVWFGSLLVILGCFVHWLELAANRLQPPHLSNSSFAAVLIAFLIATAAWLTALMFAFRRPAGD
jgi:serine/threonine-protein kinase